LEVGAGYIYAVTGLPVAPPPSRYRSPHSSRTQSVHVPTITETRLPVANTSCVSLRKAEYDRIKSNRVCSRVETAPSFPGPGWETETGRLSLYTTVKRQRRYRAKPERRPRPADTAPVVGTPVYGLHAQSVPLAATVWATRKRSDGHLLTSVRGRARIGTRTEVAVFTKMCKLLRGRVFHVVVISRPKFCPLPLRVSLKVFIKGFVNIFPRAYYIRITRSMYVITYTSG